MSVRDLAAFLQQGGLLTACFVILYGGFKGWWVWGWQHRQQMSELRRERDVYRTLALKGTSLAELIAKIPANGTEAKDQNA